MRCFAHGNCLYQVRHGNTARGLHFKPSVHVVSYYQTTSSLALRWQPGSVPMLHVCFSGVANVQVESKHLGSKARFATDRPRVSALACSETCSFQIPKAQ